MASANAARRRGGRHIAMTGPIHETMPLGVVVRRKPGVTRWARWTWQAVSVLPGAAEADWRELRREGEAVEYHAATVELTLWAAETEAYLTALSDTPPSVYVVLRESGGGAPFEVLLATASPFEAQDYADSGEDMVEKVAMPPGLAAWVQRFVREHHVHEPFVKRQRDRKRTDLVEDGKGDPRIRQTADVYRAPGSLRKARVQ
jgi:hypothetical protein